MKLKPNKYVSKEVEIFQKNIGKELIITLTHQKVIFGKLIDFNPNNLTLYLDIDGALTIIPYSSKHIHMIKFVNHHVKQE